MMASAAPLLDYIASAKARDECMQRVDENNQNWMALALLQLQQLARSHGSWANTEHGVTGEDIRVMLLPHVGHPNSPNAWGNLTMQAVRKKLIVATGEYRPMKDVRSHARKTPVYQFVSARAP
jgi:hypothetical protein